MPVVATGGTLTTYTAANGAVYNVHTFTSAGNLVVTTGGNVDYLIVAGGGGGGGWGGGGGAGGVLSGTNFVVSAGNTYAIAIGAGGTAGTSTYTGGGDGANSSALGMTSIGGGGGGWYNANPGRAGGSGGGGGMGESSAGSGGAGTAGQGYAGGVGSTNVSNWSSGRGGGGGGGGQVGYSGVVGTVGVTDAGRGGNGIQSNITGTLTYYGGGGGGHGGYTPGRSIGGLGGGGAGGRYQAIGGDNGTVNTGGGGGGAWGGAGELCGTGGSGIVIIAYSISPPILPGQGGIGGPYAGGGGGAGQDGYATTTDLITVHAFYGTGNFNVISGSGQVRYLVVGAGGGGGSDMGGGGGAGGFVTGNANVTVGNYLATIGAGGAGAPAGVGQVRGVTGGSTAVVSATNLKGCSYGFDGYGDYATVPYTTANFDWWTGDYTIEAWVLYIQANNESGNLPNMVGNMDNAGTTGYWAFGPMNNGTVRFYYYNGAAQSVTSTATVTPDTWNHIAMVHQTGVGITIYVNGVAQTTTAVSGTPQSTTTYPLTMARYNTTGLIGYISNLRVVKGTAVYTSSFTPPTSPLTAITNTTLLTAQDIAFQDNSVNNLTVTKQGDAFGGYYSPFNPMSSPGGGGGGSEYSTNNSPPASGGSGGGVASSGQTTVAYGISPIGSNGGYSGGSYYPSGGGGAGAVGANGQSNGGTGGNGLQSNILGTTYYWSGGGGGAGYSSIAGNGGLGGGGGGAPLVSGGGYGGTGGLNPGANATAGSLGSQTNVPGGAGGNNTGGGGGGGSHYNVNNQGGAGGSGFIAIAYGASSGIVATGGNIIYQIANNTITGGGYGAKGNAIQAGAAGTQGSGGGGGSSATVGGGGGGIGIDGPNGLGAYFGYINGTAGANNGGQGGGGANGAAAIGGNGGLYGGGGGGTTYSTVDTSVGNGGGGALKIYWQGNVLQYPYPVQANNVIQSGNANVSNELLDSGTQFPTPQLANRLVDSEMMFVANSTLTDNIVANVTDIVSRTMVAVQGVGPTSNNPAMNITEINVTLGAQEQMLWSYIVNGPNYLKSVEVVTKLNDPEMVDPGKVPIVVKGWTGEVYPTVQVWF